MELQVIPWLLGDSKVRDFQVALVVMDLEQEDSGGSVIPSQKCPHLFTSALDREGFLSDDSLAGNHVPAMIPYPFSPLLSLLCI